jgi:hypothetical protein
MASLNDVLIGVFYFLPERNGEKKFKYDTDRFMEFFYYSRNRYQSLQKVAFDEDGVAPRCSQLSEALDGLLITGMLENWTHEPDYYRISKSVNVAWNIVRKRVGRQIGELKRLSEEFYKAFGHNGI